MRTSISHFYIVTTDMYMYMYIIGMLSSIGYHVLVYFVLFCRIINEYETFEEKLLKVPDDSKEMMELIHYVEEAQTTLVNELKSSVEVPYGIILLTT